MEVLRRHLGDDGSDFLEAQEVGEPLRPLPLGGLGDGVLSPPAFSLDRRGEGT